MDDKLEIKILFPSYSSLGYYPREGIYFGETENVFDMNYRATNSDPAYMWVKNEKCIQNVAITIVRK